MTQTVDILTPIKYINLGDTDDCFFNFGDGGSMQGCKANTHSDGGNFTITQTVINEYGCTDTAIGEGVFLGQFSRTQFFHPNNDGVNDAGPIVLELS